MDLLTLNELSARVGNSFHGHAGRPGKRGGSLPRDASGGESSAVPHQPTHDYDPFMEKGDAPVALPIARPVAPTAEDRARAREEEFHAKRPAPMLGVPGEPDNPHDSITSKIMRGIDYEMKALDKPGRAVRGVLGGHFREGLNVLPYSDYFGITRPEQAVSGRDLLQKMGLVGKNISGFDIGDLAGFVVDVATDPLTYATFGATGVAKRAVEVAKTASKAAAITARAGGKVNSAAHAVQLLDRIGQSELGRAMVKKISEDALAKAHKLAAKGKGILQKVADTPLPKALQSKPGQGAVSAAGRQIVGDIGRGVGKNKWKAAKIAAKALGSGLKEPSRRLPPNSKRLKTVGDVAKRISKKAGQARQALNPHIKKAAEIGAKAAAVGHYLDETHTLGKILLEGTKLAEGETPKELHQINPLHNVWSDAARKAALLSKKAHALSKSSNQLPHGVAAYENALDYSKMARVASGRGDHASAAEYHAEATKQHQILAEDDRRFAPSHSKAAGAHRRAARMHRIAARDSGQVGDHTKNSKGLVSLIVEGVMNGGPGSGVRGHTTAKTGGSVPFFTTAAHKQELISLGYTPKQIAKLTPAEVIAKLDAVGYFKKNPLPKLPETTVPLASRAKAVGGSILSRLSKMPKSGKVGLAVGGALAVGYGIKKVWDHFHPNATVTANLSGAVREEIWNGRKYLVAPLSLIVEGVLNGSKGPLFYPMAEIKNNYRSWNGTPIVVYHPTDRFGRPLSANAPGVLERSGIGVVRNAGIRHPKLGAEGWFDVEKTKAVDKRVYNSLIQGKKIELSTGLHTDNEQAAPGANWNGRSYTHIARNYRPDHLAILPDQQGACSLNDGCGVLVNTNNFWSPAARQAAAEARRLSGVADTHSEMSINPKGRFSPTAGPKFGKRGYHAYHATRHKMLASIATGMGAHQAAAAHTAAANAHMKANGGWTTNGVMDLFNPKVRRHAKKTLGHIDAAKYHKTMYDSFTRRAESARAHGKKHGLAHMEKVAREHDEKAAFHKSSMEYHRDQAGRFANNMKSIQLIVNEYTINPFVSEAQRRWMYSNHPEMAKEWESHTPKGKKLPKKKGTTDNAWNGAALTKNAWSDQARQAAAMARKAKAGPDDEANPNWHKSQAEFHRAESQKYREGAGKFHWKGAAAGATAGLLGAAAAAPSAPILGPVGLVAGGFMGHKAVRDHYNHLADMHSKQADYHELQMHRLKSSAASARRMFKKKGAMSALTKNTIEEILNAYDSRGSEPDSGDAVTGGAKRGADDPRVSGGKKNPGDVTADAPDVEKESEEEIQTTVNGGPGSGRRGHLTTKFPGGGRIAPHSAMSHDAVNDYVDEANEAEDRPIHGKAIRHLHAFVDHYKKNKMTTGVGHQDVRDYAEKAGLSKSHMNRLHDFVQYQHEIKDMTENNDEMGEGEEGDEEESVTNAHKCECQKGLSANKEKNMAKLRAAERDELVDNLTTNCSGWKFKGSEEVLNKMSDDQLIALNRDWLTSNADDDDDDDDDGESGGLPDNFQQPAKGGKLPEGGPNSGVTSSGPDVASGRQEDDYPEDDISDDRDEADYESDHQQGASEMRREVTNMTPMEWLRAANAPPAIVSAVRNAIVTDNAEKKKLVKMIVANRANPYTREQLMGLSTDQLRPLAQLASGGRRVPVRNQEDGDGGRISNFWGSQGGPVQPVQTIVENADNGEDGVPYVAPTINWKAKEEKDMLVFGN